ncbi:putative sporulation protein YtxC [Paenibacillus oenotherae]|uniref:Sporulation protein YtxC n=1 Tax=Paenibacillus oenotherae TaxID=1435645 RepID=A0ABS7D486_9BACL|nr:putative sporulation protein YtxC [Paenibacillus oenotherae]MBW7474613.1 putative sporulation protein YtxC [Paenibacillus oenotherae]
MELFTISVASDTAEAITRLHGYLSEEFADLHSVLGDTPNAPAADIVALVPAFQSNEISCTAALPDFMLVEHGPPVYAKAASAIAQYVIIELEPLLLKAIIRKQFHYDEPNEVETVERYCQHVLHGTASPSEKDIVYTDIHHTDRERRKSKVAEELELYLSTSTRLHLDGFVTFRLSAYWEELREIVAYAVDEYVMDRQYQEFISLLKYFVRIQEVKLPIVHVLHKGDNEFALYDERYQLLDAAPVDVIVAEMMESEMNMEDMIVSTLITVSPEQIVIHTRYPDQPIMRTLETIFEHRVKLCTDCGHFGAYFEDAQEPVKLLSSKTTIIRRI